MPPKAKYQDGEKILCFHGPLIYEAKVIRSQVKDKQLQYHVHYSGWNKNWDEVVLEARMLKYNEQNVQKQKELQKAHEVATKAKKSSMKRKSEVTKDSDSRSSTPSMERERGLKSIRTGRSSTPVIEPVEKKKKEEDLSSKININVILPADLKNVLVDDWHLVMRQKKLVTVPSKVSVDRVIQDYISYRRTNKFSSPQRDDTLVEVMKGVKDYFNLVLSTKLLYNFERPQYQMIITEHRNKPLCEIYGAVHLLRLFVKLGRILSHIKLDKDSFQLLLFHFEQFLDYMMKHLDEWFGEQLYSLPSSDYFNKVSSHV